MSAQCKIKHHPVLDLHPRWVEFTDTKGVLMCLKPGESKSRAQGLVFDCPRCRHSKKRAHYCIFLFPNSPEGARPHGRFGFTSAPLEVVPHDFHELSITQDGGHELKPGDLKCKWQGTLIRGVVSWRPSFFERVVR